MTSCHTMSCRVVTLETDPCVCPCQYSPTHVKDQNPCLSGKCQFQRRPPPPPPTHTHTHVMPVSSKYVLKTPKNKPRPHPTFDPSRICFLILIEFGLTTPNRGIVPPVHISCDMGAWHFFGLFFFVFKPDFNHGMLTCHDMFDMFSLTCLACNMGAWHHFCLFFLFLSQTLTIECWHVTTCLTCYH